MDSQVVLSTPYCSYIWYPTLQIVDVKKAKRKQSFYTLFVRHNTEAGATLVAARDVISKVNEARKQKEES